MRHYKNQEKSNSQGNGKRVFNWLLPTAQEAERYLLGACLGEPETIEWLVSYGITAGMFSLHKHQLIYSRMLELRESQTPVTIESLAVQLAEHEQIGRVDGISYIAGLLTVLAKPVLIRLAEAVESAYRSREAMVSLMEAMNILSANDDPKEALLIADKVADMMRECVRTKAKTKRFSDIVAAAGGLDQFLEPEYSGIHLPETYEVIDELLGGLVPGRMIFVAAPAGIGKTVAIHDWMYFAARTQGIHSLLLTLEMRDTDVLYRVMSSEAEVSAHRLRAGQSQDWEMHRLKQVAKGMLDIDHLIEFVDDPDVTLPAIDGIIRKFKADGQPIQAFWLDYLQLADYESLTDSTNPVTQVEAVSRYCKRLAMRYDIPVIVVNSINREGDGIYDEPQIRWLRGSGRLENDGDQILFFWPDRATGNDFDQFGQPVWNIVNWKVAKNKYGVSGKGVYHRERDKDNALYLSRRYGKFVSKRQRLSMIPPEMPNVSEHFN